MVRLTVGALVALCAVTPFAFGQDGWRSDYESAVKEARQQNRPIVLDFGTDDCHWCRELERTTFKDQSVRQEMATRFVGIRIDAMKSPHLAQALQVQSYPTLVFATPEGKVLGKQVGYVDAAKFNGQLQRAWKESFPNPTPSAPAPTQLASTPSAPTPGVATSGGSASVATELLSEAQDDYRQQRFLSCLDRCQQIVTSHPQSNEANQARGLMAQIRGDNAVSEQISARLANHLGEIYLTQAETAMKANKPTEASSLLERVLVLAPTSVMAQIARGHLERMRQPAPSVIRGQSQ